MLSKRLWFQLTRTVAVTCAMLLIPGDAILLLAQEYPPQYQNQAPLLAPEQLDSLVAPVALYPDPLLSQILVAATYPEQILDAEAWAHRHTYLRGGDLARAIADDRLPLDPSVQALLPFPQVLDTMARDIDWTRALGYAFLRDKIGWPDTAEPDRL